MVHEKDPSRIHSKLSSDVTLESHNSVKNSFENSSTGSFWKFSVHSIRKFSMGSSICPTDSKENPVYTASAIPPWIFSRKIQANF